MQSSQLLLSYSAGMTAGRRSGAIPFGVFMPAEIERRELSCDASSEETPDVDDGDTTLEDAAKQEQEYLRRRLRDELQREPTEAELEEWLRRHTEGY